MGLKIHIQRFKIAVVALLFLLLFGVLLSLLSYASNESISATIAVFIGITIEMLVFYIWLNRLHRELLILKYKKYKRSEKDN